MFTDTWRVTIMQVMNIRLIIIMMRIDYYQEISSVFGVDLPEFQCLKDAGLKIKPGKFDKSQDRYQVSCTNKHVPVYYKLITPRFIPHPGPS